MIGFAVLIWIVVKQVIADRCKAREEDERGHVREVAELANKRGRHNGRRITKLDNKFTAVEEAQKRLIEVLKDENKELRDRYDAAVLRHNLEVVELRTELAALRAEVKKAADESRRRQEDYDKSRVEIHGLRNELALEQGKNRLLTERLAKYEHSGDGGGI